MKGHSLATAFGMVVIGCAALAGGQVIPAVTDFDQQAHIETSPLPDLKLDGGNVTVDVALNRLKHAVPQFNYVFVLHGGAKPTDLSLPPLSLEHATVGQFLGYLLKQFPELHLEVEFTSATAENPGVVFSNPSATPGAGPLYLMTINPPENPPAPPTVVRVFSLARPLEAQKLLGHNDADAINNILSLIDAAASAVDGPRPEMKVHEPTQTLIVKCTPAQAAAVEQAIAALQPADPGTSAWLQTGTAPRATTQP